ncbi:hypothetical protein [Bosea sp. NBC_00550]|uniref:hypothetical protein n=1 Tax=Bosea sp. NBC_00550 TaxID=2969621 RepID=UPI00222F4539|nr:hypothetical protein [Bosea sp. NBC_00550]UZF94384.1 hypothetical protein NWE53_09475 [Bosea sp. NBC_00550]
MTTSPSWCSATSGRRSCPTLSDIVPGYSHLRRAYSVVRNGKRVTVPVERLTPQEARTIADQQEQLAAVYLAKAEAYEREAARREAGEDG